MKARTKLRYNCYKDEDFNGEWFIRYDRSFDMIVTCDTKEKCEEVMESFEGAISKANIQHSFDSNLEAEYDNKKNVWIGMVEIHVSNDWVEDSKEEIKEVYKEWKEEYKNKF